MWLSSPYSTLHRYPQIAWRIYKWGPYPLVYVPKYEPVNTIPDCPRSQLQPTPSPPISVIPIFRHRSWAFWDYHSSLSTYRSCCKTTVSCILRYGANANTSSTPYWEQIFISCTLGRVGRFWSLSITMRIKPIHSMTWSVFMHWFDQGSEKVEDEIWIECLSHRSDFATLVLLRMMMIMLLLLLMKTKLNDVLPASSSFLHCSLESAELAQDVRPYRHDPHALPRHLTSADCRPKSGLPATAEQFVDSLIVQSTRGVLFHVIRKHLTTLTYRITECVRPEPSGQMHLLFYQRPRDMV